MKIFPLLLFFALIFALTASAQTNQSSKTDFSCPAVDVTGSENAVQPGELQTFTVKVEKFDLTKLSFKWITSSGEIIEGQGTETIKVSEEGNGENVTVTVEIEGFRKAVQTLIPKLQYLFVRHQRFCLTNFRFRHRGLRKSNSII